MKVSEIMKKRMSVSFEVFPPKMDKPVEPLFETIEKLYGFEPDFISCTYGAGGTNKGRQSEILKYLADGGRTVPVAHYTCIGNSREDILGLVREYRRLGIGSFLALRGDFPQGWEGTGGAFDYGSPRHCHTFDSYVPWKTLGFATRPPKGTAIRFNAMREAIVGKGDRFDPKKATGSGRGLLIDDSVFAFTGREVGNPERFGVLLLGEDPQYGDDASAWWYRNERAKEDARLAKLAREKFVVAQVPPHTNPDIPYLPPELFDPQPVFRLRGADCGRGGRFDIIRKPLNCSSGAWDWAVVHCLDEVVVKWQEPYLVEPGTPCGRTSG